MFFTIGPFPQLAVSQVTLDELKKILEQISNDDSSIVENSRNTLTTMLIGNTLSDHCLNLLITHDDINLAVATAVLNALDKSQSCVPSALLTSSLKKMDHMLTNVSLTLEKRIVCCDVLSKVDIHHIPTEFHSDIIQFLNDQIKYESKEESVDSIKDLKISTFKAFSNCSEIVPAVVMKEPFAQMVQMTIGDTHHDVLELIVQLIENATIENRSIYIYGMLARHIDDALKRDDIVSYTILEFIRDGLCKSAREAFLTDTDRVAAIKNVLSDKIIDENINTIISNYAKPERPRKI